MDRAGRASGPPAEYSLQCLFRSLALESHVKFSQCSLGFSRSLVGYMFWESCRRMRSGTRTAPAAELAPML